MRDDQFRKIKLAHSKSRIHSHHHLTLPPPMKKRKTNSTTTRMRISGRRALILSSADLSSSPRISVIRKGHTARAHALEEKMSGSERARDVHRRRWRQLSQIIFLPARVYTKGDIHSPRRRVSNGPRGGGYTRD